MDIREGMALIIAEELLLPLKAKSKYGNSAEAGLVIFQAVMTAIKVLDFLCSEGLVRKVEGELPRDEHIELTCCSAYGRAQQDMLKAGYCKVEPI